MLRKLSFLSFFIFVFAFGVSADTLGDNRQFFIRLEYDALARTSINATLRHVSDRAYFYVEDKYWNGLDSVTQTNALGRIANLATEFDARIYPLETQFFGSEPNPGVDNDPRITILLTPLIENAGGYFDTANQFSNTEAPTSNQREIIYLNVSELANQVKMFAFLAHEFQHLISFNQKEKLRNVSDDIWLNELRSEYAITLLGYNDVYDGSHLQRRARALLGDPADSLTEWKNLPADYGQIGLFGEYIAEHWSPQVIADTLKNKSTGFNGLAEALAKNRHPETFRDIYRDWLIANFLNDSSINIRFGYTKPVLTGLRVVPARAINNLDDDTVFAFSDSIKDWQGKWYDISQFRADSKNVLKISFNSPSLASFHISYLVFGAESKYQVYDFIPMPGSNLLYIPDIGSNVSRVVIMPIKKDKLAGFSANEPTVPLTITLERVVSVPPTASIPSSLILNHATPAPIPDSNLEPGTHNLRPDFPDGSLIRARGDNKVYVIKGSWRRHIINSRIFSFYPPSQKTMGVSPWRLHFGLGFNKVIEVGPDILNKYQESSLIRHAGSQRVYEVDKLGARRWFNISGEQFIASGRSFDSVFLVNLPELNFYRLGSRITE